MYNLYCDVTQCNQNTVNISYYQSTDVLCLSRRSEAGLCISSLLSITITVYIFTQTDPKISTQFPQNVQISSSAKPATQTNSNKVSNCVLDSAFSVYTLIFLLLDQKVVIFQATSSFNDGKTLCTLGLNKDFLTALCTFFSKHLHADFLRLDYLDTNKFAEQS